MARVTFEEFYANQVALSYDTGEPFETTDLDSGEPKMMFSTVCAACGSELWVTDKGIGDGGEDGGFSVKCFGRCKQAWVVSEQRRRLRELSSHRSSVPFPPRLPDHALVGPLGAAVRALAPQIETCREALLIELLVFFGNLIGRYAYFLRARTRHYPNEYVALVGASSRARKGTVRNIAHDLIANLDDNWKENSVIGGATSGEGIIATVRDAQKGRRRATKAEREDPMWAPLVKNGYIEDEIDPGIDDKRRVFDEEELSAVFKVASRDGNTLSERLRHFYDSGSDRIVNKNSPMVATKAHVSINGHITREELRVRLTELDAANGWGNRFLYCATRRERRIPDGVISDSTLEALAAPLQNAVAWVREHEPRVEWDDAARARWNDFYDAVEDDVEGLVGALTARSETHVLRLALILAVADRTTEARLEHLEAALAIWRYCEQSVAWVWAGMSGRADGDRILAAVEDAGWDGLSRTDIRDLFSHAKQAAEIDSAISLLEVERMVVRFEVKTSGRSATRWRSTDAVEDVGVGPRRTDRTEGGASVLSVPLGPTSNARKNPFGTPEEDR